MRALDRKVIRDLWRLRGQVIAIGLVIGSGVAVMIMALSTVEALRNTADAYYERYQFADIFAGLKRAPRSLCVRIADLPGVRTAQCRIVSYATLDIPGFGEPVIGQFVSLLDSGDAVLNRPVIRRGRSVRPRGVDEVVLNEPFADAHGLGPGDTLVAVLNGTRRKLRVVGVALSPEFIYSLGPGALMPDDRRFGVMWMGSKALAAVFDLQSSFNNVTLKLERGARPEPVIGQLDRVLERYGGIGAIPRKDQISNWFVMNEINQNATMAKILPAIFIVMAAFLTNMVLARLIAMERSEIGLMKAFGYSNLDVALHYLKIVTGIAAFGIVLGMLAGAYLGRWNTQNYADLFRFPLLLYRPSPVAFLIGAGLTLAAAMAGALRSVHRAAQLPPAQAMLPPAPPTYRRSRLAQSRAGRWLDQPTRIILRDIARWPFRSLATCVGIAFAVGLMVLALQWHDSLDFLARSYFFDAQRQHMTVGLAEPQADTIVRDFAHLPGVMAVEPMRIVSADLSSGSITHRGALSGTVGGAWLQPIFDDARGRVVETPAAGLVLGTKLADKLGVGVGDRIWIEVLEGRRPTTWLPVVALFETHIGTPAYLHIRALNRLMRERPTIEAVNLLVDSRHESAMYEELKQLPIVSAVVLRQAAIDSFQDTVVEHLMVFITMFTVFAGALGFGMAYNSARIALSERGRELATLRVLGFSRGEISYILLGQVGLLIALALPVGCVVGTLLTRLIARAFDTELFRIPIVIEPSTYGYAVTITLLATALSALLVRRRVDHLNMIEVLKTRE